LGEVVQKIILPTVIRMRKIKIKTGGQITASFVMVCATLNTFLIVLLYQSLSKEFSGTPNYYAITRNDLRN
jgi:hypothetical protein